MTHSFPSRRSSDLLVFSVLASLRDPATVPFGSAFPSPELFPLQRLARSMAQSVRDMPAREVIAEMRSEEHTSELQSLMRISYAVFCLQKKKTTITKPATTENVQQTTTTLVE